MAVQGLPGLFVDTSESADQQQNMRRLSTWSQSVSPLMYKTTGGAFGGATLPVPDAPSNAYLMIAGGISGTTSGSGTYIYSFPMAFPNGCLAIYATVVEAGVAVNTPSVSLNGVEFYFWTASGAYAGSTFALSLLALGF